MEKKNQAVEKKEEPIKKMADDIKRTADELVQKSEAMLKSNEMLRAENAPEGRFRPDYVEAFYECYIYVIVALLKGASYIFKEMSDNMLRPRERRRLIGAGVRNNGFIQKVKELALANPQFAQVFDIQSLSNCVFNFDACRNLIVDLDGFERRVRDSMLVYSDEAYSMALMFYNTIKEMARRGDGDAKVMFEMLRPFFKPHGRRGQQQEEPTVKQIERDVKALLHGTKDGKIVVEGHAKHETAAEHAAIDDTYRQTGAFKETVQGAICPQCNTHNGVNAKFCNECGEKL
jgi:ribosomal protein L40E